MAISLERAQVFHHSSDQGAVPKRKPVEGVDRDEPHNGVGPWDDIEGTVIQPAAPAEPAKPKAPPADDDDPANPFHQDGIIPLLGS